MDSDSNSKRGASATGGGADTTGSSSGIGSGINTAVLQAGHRTRRPANPSGAFNFWPHWQRTLIGMAQLLPLASRAASRINPIPLSPLDRTAQGPTSQQTLNLAHRPTFKRHREEIDDQPCQKAASYPARSSHSTLRNRRISESSRGHLPLQEPPDPQFLAKCPLDLTR